VKTLAFANLAGVLALGVLCVTQWNGNRLLEGETRRLEAARTDQAKELERRDETISTLSVDLARLRDTVIDLNAQLGNTRSDLSVEKDKNLLMSEECEQLKESVAGWSQAVSERDKRIMEDAQRITELAERLNETVLRHNDLAGLHNKTVVMLNERTIQFNELAKRYKELAGDNVGTNRETSY